MNDWRPGDPQEEAENSLTMREMLDAGIDPDEIFVEPDGDYTVTRGTLRICFGWEGDGWAYTEYTLTFRQEGEDDVWEPGNQDWVPDEYIITAVCAAIGHKRTHEQAPLTDESR